MTVAGAQREVTRRLGRAPVKTYYYGHSGGGITGRLINYSGANVAGNGKPIVDGLILDDAGNGVYLPVASHDGVDVALSSAADRRHFVPQIDLARQLYNPVSYLPAKRLNDTILAMKGFGIRAAVGRLTTGHLLPANSEQWYRSRALSLLNATAAKF